MDLLGKVSKNGNIKNLRNSLGIVRVSRLVTRLTVYQALDISASAVARLG